VNSTLDTRLDTDDRTDAHLVARLKAGDQAAYEEMVRTLGGRLLAVARRMLRDEDAARDAVQDAMLSAVRAIHGFDGHSQLSTWLHRIVVNAALMRIRSRQRRPEQSLEPLLPRFAEDGHHAEAVVSWSDSAERLIERDETRAIVRAAIDELPESYRLVVMMRDIDGLSTEEAAAAFGITENALKLRLHRARQALATILRRRLVTPPAEGRRLSAASARASRPGRSATPATLLAAR
jgi:RNA polymerase sigma-70 factor (ECF subfamily)